MLLYSPLTPQRKHILHLCYFTELQKMFPAIPHQTISVEDSLVGLVSFVTHFVAW